MKRDKKMRELQKGHEKAPLRGGVRANKDKDWEVDQLTRKPLASKYDPLYK